MHSPSDTKKKLTVEDVNARVDAIRAMAFDPEGAHSEEDRLYEDVLAQIAATDTAAGRLAAAALKTNELDFPRWCA